MQSLDEALDVTVYVNKSLPRFENGEDDPYIGKFNAAAWEARRPRPRHESICKPAEVRAPDLAVGRRVRPSRPARRTTRARVLTTRTATRTTSPSRADPDDGDPDPEGEPPRATSSPTHRPRHIKYVIADYLDSLGGPR